MHLGVEVRNLVGYSARHQPVHRLKHRYVDATLRRDGRHFKTDIAAANNRQLLSLREHITQEIDVSDATKIMDTVKVTTRHPDFAHARASGDQQLVIGERATICERNASA